jgi:hypothetical protein
LGINQYVDKLQGLAGYQDDFDYLIEFGPVANANATGIASGAAAGTVFNNFVNSPGFTNGVIDAPFGREIVMVGSGAGTNNVTITMYDHLGQMVKRTKALNGTTPVPFGIAVKHIHSIDVAGTGLTVNVGFTNRLGLPYRVSKVLEELVDGAVVTAAAVVAADLTDPATASTGDPRGLYLPTTTPDGIKQINIRALLNPWINANGHGGLHGIRAFSA